MLPRGVTILVYPPSALKPETFNLDEVEMNADPARPDRTIASLACGCRLRTRRDDEGTILLWMVKSKHGCERKHRFLLNIAEKWAAGSST